MLFTSTGSLRALSPSRPRLPRNLLLNRVTKLPQVFAKYLLDEIEKIQVSRCLLLKKELLNFAG